MEPTDALTPASGSITDIASRLALWGRRAPHGLARVEFDSDFSRQQVVQHLRRMLTEAQLPLYEIALPQNTPAADIVSYLKDQFAPLPHSIVSITGWATAFPFDVPLQDSLRILNYNRENLAQYPLCQIWWTTRSFTDTMLHEIPDLASWFILRLSLTENIATPILSADKYKVRLASVEQQDLARHLAASMQERFQNAVQAQLPLPDIIRLAIATANQLYEAGLHGAANEMSASLIRQIEQLPEYRDLLTGASLLKQMDQIDIFNALGGLYRVRNQYDLAEAFLKRALHIAEKMNGPAGQVSRDRTFWITNLASLYEDLGRYQDAELLYKQALEMTEQELGSRHPSTGASMSKVAFLYALEQRYEEAEALFKQALAIIEQSSAPYYPHISKTLFYLALLYANQGRYQEARPLLTRAVEIAETEFGMSDPNTRFVRDNYAQLLAVMDTNDDEGT